jgi:alpha-1,2-mannosyltransferase
MAGLIPHTLSRRQWAAFAALFVVYAAIAIPLGIHKGDDVTTEIAQARLLLHGLPIYDVPQTQGTWWPPCALLIVVPFAAIADVSLALAKGLWGAVGIGCLVWSVATTGRRWGWGPALGALAVVIFPIHNNFHHLNVETILLALIVATAVDNADGRVTRAGVWAGLATAIKLFPGLLLVYFAVRRQWKALAAGVGAAVVATLVSLAPLGFAGAGRALTSWIGLTVHGQNFQGGSVAGLHMQKLGRLGYALGGMPAIVMLHLVAIGLVVIALLPRPIDKDAPLDIGSVTLLAVLLAPIAWLHSFTLGYLAWVAVIALVPSRSDRRSLTLVWLLGIYASTALSAIRWPAALGFVTAYNDTIGALLALGALAWQRATRARSIAPSSEGSLPSP